MICDAHVHYGPDSMLKLTITLKDLKKHISKHNIKKMLVFAANVEIDKINKQLIEISKTNKEIFALMRLTPYNVKWVKKNLPKIYDEKIVGIKYHPSIDKVRVTDPMFSEVFEVLNDLGAISLIHTGRWIEMAGYQYAIEIGKKYPKLRVILAHMGGNELLNSVGAIKQSKRVRNVLLDTSNCRIPRVIQWAVRDLGSERILLGSDIPWGTMSANLATVQDSLDNKKDIENIIYKNLNSLI